MPATNAKKIKPRSHLRPSSFNRNVDGEVDLAKLKERFDKQLPKYGFLWRSMANARLAREVKNGDDDDGAANTSAIDEGSGELAAAKNQSAEDKENADPMRRQQEQPRVAAVDVANSKNDSKVKDSSDNEIDGDSAAADDRGENEQGPNLLSAILNKRPVSFRVPSPDHDDLCGEACECADPIIEIDDEDASVYDGDAERELVDTDDEEEGGEESIEKVETGGSGTPVELEDGIDDSAQVDDASVDDDEDDESILIIGKTPKKKKKFIIDSDDEEEESGDGASDSIERVDDDDSLIEEEEEEDAEFREARNRFILSDVSVESESVNSLSEEEEEQDDAESEESTISRRRPSPRLQNLRAKSKTLTIVDDGSEKSSSSEEEWVEISSDEEEEGDQPEQQVNTIVILSSDEEEESASGSENDDQSAFTISDDSESGASDASGVSDGLRKTGGGRPSRNKPTKSYTTPRENSKQDNSRAKSNSRSTLAFRKNRDALTSHTFTEFNQRAFQNALSSVKVTWSNKLNTTAGITRMRGKLGENQAHTRVATIELATKVIDDEDRLRSTLLHEMCHAAQWLVDGSHTPPHGKCFKKWASISMRKIRDVEVTTTHDYQIVYKYAWACTALNCNWVIKRHSRSVDPTKHCCGRCQGKIIEIEVPGSSGDTGKTGYTAKKQRKTSEFALFVKNQSADMRKTLARERGCTPREVSQADVMKGCGKLWRSRKEEASSSSNSSEGEKDGLESMAHRLVNMTLDEGYP